MKNIVLTTMRVTQKEVEEGTDGSFDSSISFEMACKSLIDKLVEENKLFHKTIRTSDGDVIYEFTYSANDLTLVKLKNPSKF